LRTPLRVVGTKTALTCALDLHASGREEQEMTKRETRVPWTSARATCWIALSVTVVAVLSGACSRARAPAAVHESAATHRQHSSIPRADRPPAALRDLAQAAILLFDDANASDWSSASVAMLTIQGASSSLPLDLPTPDVAGQLRSRLKWLGQHVRARDRLATMDDANGVMRLAAEWSAQFQTDVPYDVLMLGYYGRQLELGIAAGRPDALTHASTDLRSTWNRIEPTVETRATVDDVRRFTDIVARLEGAHTTAQFVAPTRVAVAEAKRFEQLFHSRT
jgi:hypothetical protein